MSRALHITAEVSSFIPPSQQMKPGAFCLVKEVISWSDAGGGPLEIDQWQICGSGSQQLEMMKLYFRVRPHLHTLKPAQTPGCTLAASMFLQAGSTGTDGASVLVRMLLSSFILGVQKKTWGQGWVLPFVVHRGQRLEHLGLIRTSGFCWGHWDSDSHNILSRSAGISLKSVVTGSCPLLYKSQRCYWTSKTTSEPPGCSRQSESRGGEFRAVDLHPVRGLALGK